MAPPTSDRPMKRDRLVRTLTFWLRPEFILRVVNRFQKIAGFDRSIALASGALTALIPLSLLASAMATHLGGKNTADRIISRYELTGGGAEAVRDIFAPPTGTSTTLGIIGIFFLLVAVLSFTRAVQRLFELGWDLKPMSVRNSLNGLLWVAGLAAFMVLSGVIRGTLGHTKLEIAAAVFTAPLAAIFVAWTGQILTAKRISLRAFAPTALLAATLLAIYSIGATVYVPHLFSTYATRYGVIGAVFAMISALFCVMVVLVFSVAAGREINDELERIKRGETPAEDEVQRQWAEITAQAREQWEALTTRLDERRGRGHSADEASAPPGSRGLSASAHGDPRDPPAPAPPDPDAPQHQRDDAGGDE